MPCCSASHCKLKREMGVRVFRFPKNPERRQKWIEFCDRSSDWCPKQNTLCEIHFTDDQFDRLVLTQKGNRKLRSDAVPTIKIQSNDYERIRSIVQSRQLPNNNFNEIGSEQTAMPVYEYVVVLPGDNKSTVTKAILPEISIKNEFPDNVTTERTLSVGKSTDNLETFSYSENGIEDQKLTAEGEVKAPPKRKLKTMAFHLKQQRVRRLMHLTKIAFLENRIKHLVAVNTILKTKVAENQIKKMQIKNLNRLFNSDQLETLFSRRPNHWTGSTIEQSLKIRMACGRKGYEYLLSLGYPFPSEKTLLRATSTKDSTTNNFHINFSLGNLDS